MQTVNIAELKSNLSAFLEMVRNGEELIVKDRNRPIARLMPLHTGEDLNAEEEILVGAGLMRLPLEPKSEEFFDLPAPDVSIETIRQIIRDERDED
jgi:prevent-host-death family protein